MCGMRHWFPLTMNLTVITACKRSLEQGYVLLASAILFTGSGGGLPPDRDSPRQTPPNRETHWTETSRTDRDTPVLTSSGGHRSGRYASYWNANVFQMYLDTCVSFLYFNVQYLGITQCFDDTVTIL